MKSVFLLLEGVISILWGVGIIRSINTDDCRCDLFWILFAILLIIVGILSIIYNFMPNPVRKIFISDN